MTFGNGAFVATLATGLFAGGALDITLAEQPARLACDAPCAIAQWRQSYRRASAVQAPLAIVAALTAFTTWLDAGGAWLVTALAMAGIVLFTLVVVFPTNHVLQDDRLDVDSVDALVALRRWGNLHVVRTIVALAAFAIDLALLAG